MTAETAAISVTKTERVVRYTLPTPTKAPLTTASKAVVLGPPLDERGLLGGAEGTGAVLPTITSLGPQHVGDVPLLIRSLRRPDCEIRIQERVAKPMR